MLPQTVADFPVLPLAEERKVERLAALSIRVDDGWVFAAADVVVVAAAVAMAPQNYWHGAVVGHALHRVSLSNAVVVLSSWKRKKQQQQPQHWMLLKSDSPLYDCSVRTNVDCIGCYCCDDQRPWR